jgi:hypothetical protein
MKVIQRGGCLLTYLGMLCFDVQVVFGLLWLCGVIDWAWYWVISPAIAWWAWFAIVFYYNLIMWGIKTHWRI